MFFCYLSAFVRLFFCAKYLVYAYMQQSVILVPVENWSSGQRMLDHKDSASAPTGLGF